MTPKEKAEELVGKYYFQVQTLEQQKQCALIAVEEIIKANPYSNPLHPIPFSNKDFWFDVMFIISKWQ